MHMGFTIPCYCNPSPLSALANTFDETGTVGGAGGGQTWAQAIGSPTQQVVAEVSINTSLLGSFQTGDAGTIPGNPGDLEIYYQMVDENGAPVSQVIQVIEAGTMTCDDIDGGGYGGYGY